MSAGDLQDSAPFEVGGRKFGTGLVATPESLRNQFRSSAPIVIPPSEWSKYQFEHPEVIPIKDQGEYPSCNGHAAASSMEWAYWLRDPGMIPINLSAWYIWTNLTNGQMEGSSIGDALAWLQGRGTPLDQYVPHTNIPPRQISSEANVNALKHQIELGNDLPTWSEIVSGVILNQFGNISIKVGNGNRFGMLDAEGCPPVTAGPGDHAICFGMGFKVNKDGEALIKCANSWTDKFGIRGYFWYRRQHWMSQTWFNKMQGEAYSVKVPSINPDTAGPAAPN